MVAGREGLRWLRQGVWVDLPEKLQWFGLSQLVGKWALISAALVAVTGLALACRHLAAGRFVYALGSDAEAARLAGIRPRLATFWLFVFLGGLTGLAAIMNVAQSPQVDPNSGTGLELRAIAATVVGGVAVSGGRGSLPGVLAASMLLACVGPGLTFLHVEPHWEKAIQGAVILLAVVADGARRRNQR
jgi:rhamnose transport system permease protein